MWWQINTEIQSARHKRHEEGSFRFTKKYLYVADNESLEQSDKYAKGRLLFATINEQFLRHMPFERKLRKVCIDKIIMLYFGRLGWQAISQRQANEIR